VVPVTAGLSVQFSSCTLLTNHWPDTTLNLTIQDPPCWVINSKLLFKKGVPDDVPDASFSIQPT